MNNVRVVLLTGKELIFEDCYFTREENDTIKIYKTGNTYRASYIVGTFINKNICGVYYEYIK